MQKLPSPFYVNRPVPVDMFVGRRKELERIQRSAREVAAGKFDGIFVSGEYGIGKTSLAQYSAAWAKAELKLFPIHVLLGGAKTIDQLSEATIRALSRTDGLDPTTNEKVRTFLAKYIGDQEFFGIKLNLDSLRPDLPNISSGFIGFLDAIHNRVGEAGYKGIFLIFDEVNGIAAEPAFAHFLKTLVEVNAISPTPTPLLLMLCGTEQIRRQITDNHKPVERIFRLADISPLSNEECAAFFVAAFQSIQMSIAELALAFMVRYSGGLPKLAHIIGEEVYYAAAGENVTPAEAVDGVWSAADEIGRKVIDSQVYDTIKSDSYKKILQEMVSLDEPFKRSEIASRLEESEKKRLDNFLQKMKDLNVLSGDGTGQYFFSDRLTALYIRMRESRGNVTMGIKSA